MPAEFTGLSRQGFLDALYRFNALTFFLFKWLRMNPREEFEQSIHRLAGGLQLEGKFLKDYPGENGAKMTLGCYSFPPISVAAT